MQGFLPCFTSEVFWSRHLPSCLWHFKHRMVAAFAWTCIGFSYFHSLPHCPKNPLSESPVTQICVFAFWLQYCLFVYSITQGYRGRKGETCANHCDLRSPRSFAFQLLKYTEWNLENFGHTPQLTESFSCLLWIVQSIDILLTLLPSNLPFYITSILLLGFPISIAGGFIPQLSQSLRNNAMHCSDFFSIPCPT